ncbi:MAG: LLM class flavin-dependent oxidoreductase [bacterium]|nr:LLM class flavin-dependent oxidoreductase [bacterium]
MRVGYQIGHWGKDARVGGCDLPPLEVVERLREAESWGCDSVWAPESYFAEAYTFLSWIGAHTERMKLGTAVAPIQSRTPVNFAQMAITLDHLTQGRVVVGLGVTGINVAEGWFGQRFDKPLARTREYVSIMRAVLAGERPENADGEFYPLPVPNGVGSRKALKSPVRPYRKDLPIVLGAIGPRNMALAAEIADGWMPAAYMPDREADYVAMLDEGFARPGARRSREDFFLPAAVTVVVDDDLDRASRSIRQSILYQITVMGHGDRNFQFDLFARAGFEAEAHTARRLFGEGRVDEATGAISQEMVDAIALVGPRERVLERLPRWTSGIANYLIVRGDFEALRTILETGGFERPGEDG